MITARPPDRGSATIEFATIGVLLLVPLVYVVIVLGRVQAAAFAADSSARAAGRAFVTAPNDDDAHRRAEAAVRLGLLDQGFTDPRDGDLGVECANRQACLSPGAEVLIRVEVRVILPGVPSFVDRSLSTGVTVRAEQMTRVDEFRSRGDFP